MNTHDYARVIRDVSTKLRIGIDETLINNITYFCRSRDVNMLKSRYPSAADFYAALTDSYINHIMQKDDIENQHHTDMQMEARHKKPTELNNTITQLGVGSKNAKNIWFLSRAMHINIDSVNRNTSRDTGRTIKDFLFVLSDRNDRAMLGSGVVPARIIPANITYLKIGPIAVPYSRVMDTMNISQIITLTFTGLRANGAILSMQEGNETIHFNFTITRNVVNPDIAILTPTNKYCKFDPPITYLDDISFRLNDPRYAIPFVMDRATPSNIDYGSNPGLIVFSSPHQLATGDVIRVFGLTTLNDAINSTVLATINDPRGLLVTVVDATSLTIDVDFTSIINPNVSSRPVIVFTSKCFQIPLEIGYQDVDTLA